jgi:predicted O-linked N-acetylglucosamine transferase (SPINDLY family)
MKRVEMQPPASPAARISALVDSGQSEEAERQARDLVRQAPEDSTAWRVLGYALLGRGNYPEAERTLRKALELAPQDAVALEHLGWLHQRAGRLTEAVASLKASLAADQNRVRARVILANVYLALDKPRRAVAHYERALAQQPDHFRAHNNLAGVLVGLGQLQSAAQHYQRAAALAPDLAYQISAAHLARRICDWDTAETLEPKILAGLRAGPKRDHRTQPFPLLAMPGATGADLMMAGAGMARSFPSVAAVPHRAPAELAAGGKLRIGYLSPDFHDHPTTHLIVEALELHDRSRFEIVAFDCGRDHKVAYRERALAAFDKVVSVRGMSDDAAARAIAAEGVAIAVDLSGWTTNTRPQILARRPAPVQAQWLGYPGSMGAPWIDYMVADPVVAPRGCEAEFSEKLLRLPHTYQPNDSKREIGARITRAEAGLPEDAFVFCNFNQPFKITRQLFAFWMDLLRERPGAVLWLLDDNRWATETLQKAIAAHGIAAARVIFGNRLPLSQHLARLRLADLALDCPPCGSHTTASDALWAGTPHLAARGNSFSARVSSSLMTAIGLPELIAETAEDYRALALRLSRDRSVISMLKAKLAVNRLSAPLFDSRRFTRHLEAAYEAIWRRKLDGLPPDHVDIEALA